MASFRASAILSLMCAITPVRTLKVQQSSSHWCQDLAVTNPPRQPCWAPVELERRRAFANPQSGEETNTNIEENLRVMANDKNGNSIFPSEGGQDRWLWNHHFRALASQRKPVYLDIGTNDAVFTSNTFFYDHCLGAQGVCVEPNPNLAKRVSAMRSCKLVHGCLSDKPEEVTFEYQDKDWSTASGIVDENFKGARKLAAEGGSFINMTCTTGSSVLEDAGIKHVDWMDLDAEGHELAILKGIDFGKYQVDIITVEDNDPNVAEYLKQMKYRKTHKVHYDNVFLREGFEMLNPEARQDDACVESS